MRARSCCAPRGSRVALLQSMAEMRTDFVADPEMMIMAEVLLLNTALHTIELKKNKLGDDGISALSRAIGTSKLPIKARAYPTPPRSPHPARFAPTLPPHPTRAPPDGIARRAPPRSRARSDDSGDAPRG